MRSRIVLTVVFLVAVSFGVKCLPSPSSSAIPRPIKSSATTSSALSLLHARLPGVPSPPMKLLDVIEPLAFRTSTKATVKAPPPTTTLASPPPVIASTTTTPVTSPPTTQPPAPSLSPAVTTPAPTPATAEVVADPNVGYGDMNPADWAMTATCEEGGANSYTYGYYGILPSTWAAYGGTVYSPTAGGASQYDQLVIESHFQHYPPDVSRCNGGY